MSKRVLSLAVCALLFAPCFSASAQQPTKIPRIGFLVARSPSANADRIEAFRQGLRELGYVEGKNIVIEWRFWEEKADRLPALAAELVRLKVDIIVTGGATNTRAAKEATSTIPIVMTQAGDPVGSGFVASLARPGGNITGLSTLAPELSGKRLELLREIVPGLTRELGGKRLELLKEAVPKVIRIAVFYEPATPANVREVNEDLPVAARALKLTVQPWEVRAADGFERIFAALSKERPDGLHVLGSPLLNNNQKRIAGFALKSRLPSMYNSREAVDAGGLMSYGADIADSYRRVAYYVDRILKGAKPADLPVEQPTKFQFVINLKTAKQIGLTIPQSMLYRADKVIK